LLTRLRVDVVRQLMQIQINFEQQPPPLEEQPLPQMQAHHINPLTGEDEMGELPPDLTRGLRLREASDDVDPNDPDTWGRVSRNAPCPCGSGKKFKHCHGALV
jgi:preprotein translocase subunit SecA